MTDQGEVGRRCDRAQGRALLEGKLASIGEVGRQRDPGSTFTAYCVLEMSSFPAEVLEVLRSNIIIRAILHRSNKRRYFQYAVRSTHPHPAPPTIGSGSPENLRQILPFSQLRAHRLFISISAAPERLRTTIGHGVRNHVPPRASITKKQP